MSPEAVHAVLADLERKATRVEVRDDGCEVWRFRVEADGLEYDLHFYDPEKTTGTLGVGPAAREFSQLKALQELAIPATRVIANLRGLRIGERKGDATIVVHDPRATPVDQLLRDWPPEHHTERLKLLASFIERLESLSRVKMLPVSLRPGRFAVRADGVTTLLDGATQLQGSIDARRLAELDLATRHATSVGDRLRVWRATMGQTPPPQRTRTLGQRIRERLTSELFRTGEFHEIAHAGWRGRALRRSPMIIPWSSATTDTIPLSDWERVLPILLDASRGTPLKFDESSLVTTQFIELAGRQIEIVSKRPLFKAGLHGTTQRYRRSRAMRAWIKTWRLLATGFPCEVPLLVLERRRAWRLLEQLIVVERVPGPTLEHADLNAVPPAERSRLFWSAGRTLRRMEREGFRHADAKSANWIAWSDPRGRVKPIMLDLDAMRTYGRRGEGAARLARSLRAHPQATEADLAALDAAYRWPAT